MILKNLPVTSVMLIVYTSNTTGPAIIFPEIIFKWLIQARLLEMKALWWFNIQCQFYLTKLNHDWPQSNILNFLLVHLRNMVLFSWSRNKVERLCGCNAIQCPHPIWDCKAPPWCRGVCKTISNNWIWERNYEVQKLRRVTCQVCRTLFCNRTILHKSYINLLIYVIFLWSLPYCTLKL